ncbi:glycosyltransferase family A protein [Citrobacter koseri]|uniref:glycosyltransferase family 2 protein n=1 Tax=Citrobacter koseri TaxID=545 RepID=UPI0023B09EB8|nr:glycosyltransferase family A protein [Citrobacter koseri]WOJ32473.1 glycosyltransferase family A protein [Citrobacter koseri]WOJ36646.1 glycosyltransferase family A protein [Citrobacter koseri]HBL6931551.1 glycosyltransferase family 2 protein [Citrobacter koseri]
MPKFSIIVPIYNVGEYLEECLTSIAKQTFNDFECLLVNDGSTDNSAAIASYYSTRDVRFKYYEKSNGGLSDARNYGLNKATGEYIVFVDSDDIISRQLLKFVDVAIVRHRCDLVYFNYVKFYDLNKNMGFVIHNDEITPNISLISNAELAKKPNFAWARVARRGLYRDISFPVGLIYEDVLTSPLLTSVATKISYVTNDLYGYRKRDNSITTSSAERQFKLFETVDLLKEHVLDAEIPYEYYSTAFVNLIQSCLVSLVRIKNAKSRNMYRQMINERYKDLSVSEILSCYSLNKFKLLTLLAKNKITLTLLSIVLSPIVSFSDKKGK